MSDRSLDDFGSDSDEADNTDAEAKPVDTDSEAANADTEDADTDDADAEPVESGPETDESTLDPAVATATVSPDKTTCPSCGETVRRCWHDDGTYVCRECKEW
jgi:predicted RNA-binding Zn-ribbon protein involved in translation (DUF1610 family)